MDAVVHHLPCVFLLVTCPWVSALYGPIIPIWHVCAQQLNHCQRHPCQKHPDHHMLKRAVCGAEEQCVCSGQMALFLHWENWSQNVKAVFCTGVDCSLPKGNSSVTGFYFVVPKQNCSHTVKQDNILAFPSWLRMKGNVFGLSVGWTQFPSSLQQEHTPCQEARMSPRDVLLLLSARLIQPVSFKVCGNELQSHHSCGGFSEEIAEGSQRLWKSPFR